MAIIAALEQDQSAPEIVAEVEAEIVIQDRREEVETEMIEDEIEVEIDHVTEIEDEDNCPITQYESYFSSFLFVFHLFHSCSILINCMSLVNLF